MHEQELEDWNLINNNQWDDKEWQTRGISIVIPRYPHSIIKFWFTLGFKFSIT